MPWRLPASAALLALAAGAWSQADKPVILIVQTGVASLEKEYGKGAENQDMLVALKKAFSDDGRLKVVIWKKKDPEFEAATASMVLPDVPNDEQISSTARGIQSRYILIVEAVKNGDQLHARADLYQTGRRGTLWTTGPRKLAKNEGHVVKLGENADWDATAASRANTWVVQMGQGPLRQLGVGSPLLPDPYANAAGERPPARVDLAASAGAEALAMAEDMIRQGRTSRAILYLKDSIDANPFDPARRIRLMELLVEEEMPLEAAEEGRRAARLAVSQPELWLACSKAWLLAGKPEEAEQDAKEALARGVDSALSRRLLGDVALIRGEIARARDEYSLSMERADTVRARLGLAVSFSLIGQPTLAKAILTKKPAVEGPLEESDYAFLTEILAPIVRAIGRDLADLMPQIRVSMGDAKLTARARELAGEAQAVSEVMSLVTPPDRHAPSHGARVLAHKLMVQASEEVLSFAKGSDSEAGLEVVMSLGEALRQLGTARESYRQERQSGASGPP